MTIHSEIEHFLKEHFGIKPDEIKPLDGYHNLNFLVRSGDNKFVYKTYPYDKELFDITSAENDAINHLKNVGFKRIPRPIKTESGQYQFRSSSQKQKTHRLLSYLEGDFLGDTVHTESLIESFGAYLAKMNVHLQSFDSYVLRARQWPWDLQYVEMNRPLIQDIHNAKDRNLVLYFLQQYEEQVRPYHAALRKQVIHNDANEWNVLTNNDKVAGIIDFGDIAHSFLINELAIALTYTCYDKENPLYWAKILIKAYHQVLPLKELEIQVLYYQIAARLCTSVCNSAHAKKTNPDNNYASVSEQKAWQMLYKWLSIGPIKAEHTFRSAIGLEPKQFKSTHQLLNKRYEHISKILSTSYKEPIHMVRSAYQYMYAADGNTYLDAYNNIPHVGHSHPKVVKAGQDQMAVLNTNTRYLYDHLSAYAEKLLSKFPNSLKKVFFVNSGSAASDLAIRMANYHTKHQHIMILEDGYHGNTQVSIDISDYKFNNPKGQGQKSHILKTPIPNTFNGKYRSDKDNAGYLYGKDAVDQIKRHSEPISAFIAEPIVGCAGQVPLPKGYLQQIYPVIRAEGGLCISDEVQTGFGRVGNAFWGFELLDVVPDIVVLGKPIANGHPMGAVVCTDAVASSFEQGVEFFSSFGGNPVSCAIASAVLDIIEEENLQLNAKIVGDYYQSRLLELAEKHTCIGDVRGSGLFIGIEVVKNNSTTPDPELASYIKNKMKARHILISTDGPFNNVIKTKPPLCFSKDNVDQVIVTLDHVLSAYQGA